MSPAAAGKIRRCASSAQPPRTSRRLRRERHTVEVMMAMYCRGHHTDGPATTGPRPACENGSAGVRLCPDCAALLDYAVRRIDVCRFGEHKPTCAHCAVHCFRATEREAIRGVMRYSGPRMVWWHPYLATRHLLDRRQVPPGLH